MAVRVLTMVKRGMMSRRKSTAYDPWMALAVAVLQQAYADAHGCRVLGVSSRRTAEQIRNEARQFLERMKADLYEADN
jgi:hypothetical protein